MFLPVDSNQPFKGHKTFDYQGHQVTAYWYAGSICCDIAGTYIRHALWTSTKKALDLWVGEQRS